MIKKICIYDLDGTIIDSSHRYQLGADGRIDLNHWVYNDTPENILKDELLPLAGRYVQDLKNPEVFVIVATARACTNMDANYAYLYNVLGKPDVFIHREGRNDLRGGAELKIVPIKQLLKQPRFKNAAVHVYEDNMKYLHDMCHAFKTNHVSVGHFNPSEQGY